MKTEIMLVLGDGTKATATIKVAPTTRLLRWQDRLFLFERNDTEPGEGDKPVVTPVYVEIEPHIVTNAKVL